MGQAPRCRPSGHPDAGAVGRGIEGGDSEAARTGQPELERGFRANSSQPPSSDGPGKVEKGPKEKGRKQGRPPLDYLRQVLIAHRTGQPIPSLLPTGEAVLLTP